MCELTKEVERLRAEVARLEAERGRLACDLFEAEHQNANLANLCVASHRLHSTIDRADVLAGIQEIIVNLVGSEELMIWEVCEHDTPRLVASVGVQAGRIDDLPGNARNQIEECMRSRQLWVREGVAGPSDPLTACIPMVVNERPTGVIAIFRLLQQKNGLADVDLELFAVLATQAATALHFANLHATETAVM
jgi:GAF domain-containing protein